MASSAPSAATTQRPQARFAPSRSALNEAIKQVGKERAKRPWADEIVPGLYLGSATAAEDLTGLKKHHVTHIVNVADDVPNYHEDTGCFKYLNLQVADFGKDKGISRVFEQAAKFVATALGWPHASDTSTGVGDDGGTVATTTTTAPASAGTGEAVVLVHCAAGRNRSVAVVLGVLMVAQNMSLKQAHTTMLKVRATVCPFRDNRKELVAFELRTRGKSTLGEASFA